MDTQQPFVIQLPEAFNYPKELIGNKARNLSICMNKGYKVPHGFCISAAAYQDFIRLNDLKQRIDLELYRKDLKEMRWEEIWDVALRIRSFFLKGEMPPALRKEILGALAKWPAETKFALRSSSAAEDSSAASFAGIHESYLNISANDCFETVKLVWASLWSDRSLLYRALSRRKKTRFPAEHHAGAGAGDGKRYYIRFGIQRRPGRRKKRCDDCRIDQRFSRLAG